MKIGVIGVGYVGLVSAVCFSSVGHNVIAFDSKVGTIEKLSKGISTIYEEGLESMLHSTLKQESIQFSTDISLLIDCEIVLISVGTPSLPNGDADMSYVQDAIRAAADIIPPTSLILLRSTVPIGSTRTIREMLNSMGKHELRLGFCPEFLREGSAVFDFKNPFLLVFASDSSDGIEMMKRLYQPIIDIQKEKVPQVVTSIFESAELIKYTINTFLATKVTFINQIAQLAQQTGANMTEVIEAISADKRIGRYFLNPGPGFGGSCFPKDTQALVQRGLDYHVNLSVVREVSNANKKHKEYISSWILNLLHLNNKEKPWRVGVWGLTFKANTDDVRDSASIDIISNILLEGYSVYAHDPKGIKNFQQVLIHNNLHFYENALEFLEKVDALIILTEWEEYRTLVAAEQIRERFADTIVFDTRGVCSEAHFAEAGLVLHQFGLQ